MFSIKCPVATTEWVSWVSRSTLQLLSRKNILSKSVSSIEVNHKAYILASLSNNFLSYETPKTYFQ